MNWYIEVLKKYAVFGGRASRSEYWYFTLFNLIITFVLIFIDAATGSLDAEAGLGILSGIYTLAVLVPTIAVGVRRLHDTSRSGWWFLIVLIPLIGSIVLLIFFVLDSTLGTNEYGANPKNDPGLITTD